MLELSYVGLLRKTLITTFSIRKIILVFEHSEENNLFFGEETVIISTYRL